MASPTSTDDLTNQLSQLQLSSTAEPLTSFIVFPKLPIELRLKIWNFALPMPPKRVRRILRVRARVSTTLKTKDYSRFFLEDNPHAAFIRDIGMLGASWESREVYLSFFTNFLNTGKKGVIRYHVNDIIYISNMEDLMANQYVQTAIRDHRQFEHLFSTCEIVALPTKSFESLLKPSLSPLYDYVDLLASFGNLRGLGAVLEWTQYPGLTQRKADGIRRRWWCNLGQIEMIWARSGLWPRHEVHNEEMFQKWLRNRMRNRENLLAARDAPYCYICA